MLSETKARHAKPRARPVKVADGGGLYLYVAPSGAKSWRYDYRLNARRETLTIGPYPEVSLSEARDRHYAARKQVERGESPARVKRHARAAAAVAADLTFQSVSKAWYEENEPHKSKSWRTLRKAWLAKYINRDIGSTPIGSVETGDVLRIVNRVRALGYPRAAEGVRQTLSRIFDYAILRPELHVKTNPAAPLRGKFTLPPVKSHKPIDAKRIPAFFRALSTYPCRSETRCAIKLLAYTFTRKVELLHARWEEFDFDAAEWRIPAERMKQEVPHIVPLSTQAVAILRSLETLGRDSDYVFTNLGNVTKPMSPSTLNVAFDRMGFADFTPHGWRSTASTILNEKGWRPDVIERQLAHTERNSVRAAYNHADYMDDRRRMMQAWADHLDGLIAGANVASIRMNPGR
jgi:integrase